MKRRKRAWRRWGERGARWGLTLLLVGLVGVTVASGWWRLGGVRMVAARDRSGTTVTFISVRGGSLHRSSAWVDAAGGNAVNAQSFSIRRYGPVTASGAPFRPGRAGLMPGPMNLWRLHRGRGRLVVPLTYPIVAVALPTFFLWHRRLRRRYRRGLCHTCGYDLAGLLANEDRITCPECGSGTPAARVGGRPTMLKAKKP